MKKLLVVANDFPYPPVHGAAVDMWTRILILIEMGYVVDLVATVRDMPEESQLQTVREKVRNLWVLPRRSAVRSILSLLPFQVSSRIGLRDIALGQHYDAVLLEAEYVAPFLKNPAARQAKIILRVHNEQIGYFRELAEGCSKWWKKIYYYSESFKFRFFSSTVRQKCDLLWFISDSERQDHVQRNPADERKSFFLPTHISPSTLRPYSASGRTVLYIGTLTISHNSDSVAWYIQNVHPLLSDMEGYSFQVAGRTAGQPIPSIKSLVNLHANISLEENPPVLDGLYERGAVFVNPVIRGAGVKIKVCQALQEGLPVVSTSMGVEGTGFEDSVHVLIADTPQEFANCVRRLLIEPGLAETLTRNAQMFLAERYDMKTNMQKTLSEVLSASH